MGRSDLLTQSLEAGVVAKHIEGGMYTHEQQTAVVISVGTIQIRKRQMFIMQSRPEEIGRASCRERV